jgi:hypothetical protein
MSQTRLADLDWKPLLKRRFHPSPSAWEDQVLYFLLPDRFSDGTERAYLDIRGRRTTGGTTDPFNRARDLGNAIQTPSDAQTCERRAGPSWAGH